MLRWLHRLDYALFLPLLARLPLSIAFALGAARGKLNAATGRDWRSVALETRHIQRQSRAGFRLLPSNPTLLQIARWTRERFEVEARDELEASWVAARRLNELRCSMERNEKTGSPLLTRDKSRGLVLLTPHYDSFYLGIAFLAQSSGWRVNSMSSAVARDPRVETAVSKHFESKYRGLEHYLNGGLVLDMEMGLRPFYRMLEQSETLVVLADAPVLPNGVGMTLDFLGGRRTLAGGALRLAQRTQSQLGGYICRYLGAGQYAMQFCALGDSNDPQTIENIYQYFTQTILQKPGPWWAADLLPNMPLESN